MGDGVRKDAIAIRRRRDAQRETETLFFSSLFFFSFDFQFIVFLPLYFQLFPFMKPLICLLVELHLHNIW